MFYSMKMTRFSFLTTALLHYVHFPLQFNIWYHTNHLNIETEEKFQNNLMFGVMAASFQNYLLGISPKFPTYEKQQKKIEKTHAKEKQSHAQDNIYVIRQFAYVHRIARISLLSRKNYKCGSTLFQSLKNNNNKNPNHQKRFLHRLNLKKSSIKNHATLFGLGQVVNRIKHKLGSTKPNTIDKKDLSKDNSTGCQWHRGSQQLGSSCSQGRMDN